MKTKRYCTDPLLQITDFPAGFGTQRIYLLIWSKSLLTSVTLRKQYGECNVFLLPLNAAFKIAKAAVGKLVFFHIDLNTLHWCLWLPAGLQPCYTETIRAREIKTSFLCHRCIFSTQLFLLLRNIIYLLIYSLMSQLIFKKYFFGE